MRVLTIDPRHDPRWEAYVVGHPAGSVHHHPAWLQVLEKVYGYRQNALAVEDVGGRVHGVLPLFYRHGLLQGRTCSSLPHTPYAGPLADDDRSAAALTSSAVRRVRDEPGLRLELKTRTADLDRCAEAVVKVPWGTTYVRELPEQASALRFGDSRNHARIKWSVNKAARAGVRVRVAETEDELRMWYRLYLVTMRWHAVPPRPYRFFEACWQLLRPQGLMRLLLAEQQQTGQSTILCGSIFFMCSKTVSYAFSGRRREALALRPNDAIQWHAIQRACEEGYRYYDFGEVDEENQGLAEFKTKWGARPVPLYRYYHPAPSTSQSSWLRSGGSGHRLLATTWRRLPLGATARLGGWIYRYL